MFITSKSIRLREVSHVRPKGEAVMDSVSSVLQCKHFTRRVKSHTALRAL